jgi:predicted TIM-barrel fold metal-dependent hydrolase
MGFRGLKLYPTYQGFYANDSIIYPLYAKAEELGIPVMIHTGSSIFTGARLKYGDPLWIDDVAVDFPELPLIQVHSGRGFWYRRAFFLARLHRNVYMGIAGLPPLRLLDYFPELEKNSDKIVFGTDWPGLRSIKSNIEAIRSLPITEETKAKILGDNAARLLGRALPG